MCEIPEEQKMRTPCPRVCEAGGRVRGKCRNGQGAHF